MLQCENCKLLVIELEAVGLSGKCYHVCKDCKDGFRDALDIKNMPKDMQEYFETGM